MHHHSCKEWGIPVLVQIPHPWEGDFPELWAVQEDHIFLFFAMNNSLTRYVYYCSVQILYKKKRVEGQGKWNTSPSVIIQIPLQKFTNSTAMAFIKEKSFKKQS